MVPKGKRATFIPRRGRVQSLTRRLQTGPGRLLRDERRTAVATERRGRPRMQRADRRRERRAAEPRALCGHRRALSGPSVRVMTMARFEWTRRVRSRCSPALVVACVALLVALGGTSYATVIAIPAGR